MLEWLGDAIFSDDQHLLHLFHEVHFGIFFVMISFIIEVVVVVFATLRTEAGWIEVEKKLQAMEHDLEKHHDDAILAHTKRPIVNEAMDVVREHAKAHSLAQILGPLHPLTWKLHAARDAMVYVLLRERFLSSHGRHSTAEKILPPDFDFSNYLRRCSFELLHQVLHVTWETWVTSIMFLLVTIEVGALLEVSHASTLTVGCFLMALAWALWLFAWSVYTELKTTVGQLTPRHPLIAHVGRGLPSLQVPASKHFQQPAEPPPELAAQQSSSSSVAGSSAPSPGGVMKLRRGLSRWRGISAKRVLNVESVLEEPAGSPPYEWLTPTKTKSKHDRLFWFGRNGPKFLVWLMRTLMLICAVITGIVISWAQQPEDEEPHLPIGKPYWWVVLIALAPVLHVGYFFPSYLLPYLTMATSVEQHRQPHIAQKTFHEMQAEKTLRVLKTLALLQSHAKGLHRKKDKSERTSTAAEREAEAMKRMSKDELGELRQAFDLFDVDGSGTIDKHELEGLLQSLGEQHTPSELAGIMAELGGDDGEMSFGEFCVAMSDDIDQDAMTPKELARAIFQQIDKDSTGKITLSELSATMQKLDPSLTLDELARIYFDIFEPDSKGELSETAFVNAIETMKTFH